MMYTMERMMKKQSCASNPTPSTLVMHRDSRIISKVKPKIRIIHIFAPEIIKTDIVNFRELVQRLTGKPTENSCCTKNKPRRTKKEEPRTLSHMPMPKKMDLTERIKGEEEIWGGANSGESFLGGFAHLEYGFVQELNGSPLLPLDASHMNVYGETQLA